MYQNTSPSCLFIKPIRHEVCFVKPLSRKYVNSYCGFLYLAHQGSVLVIR